MTLQRISDLVIPPAWQDVWICPLPNGHIQATGTDAAGRRQYRYHDQWRGARGPAEVDPPPGGGPPPPPPRRPGAAGPAPRGARPGPGAAGPPPPPPRRGGRGGGGGPRP